MGEKVVMIEMAKMIWFSSDLKENEEPNFTLVNWGQFCYSQQVFTNKAHVK